MMINLKMLLMMEKWFFFKNEDELPKLILDAMEMDLDVLKENALKSK